MKRALSFAVLLLPVVALACAEEKAPPPEFPPGEEEAIEVTPELAEYGIDPTEYVATEGDPEFAVWPGLVDDGLGMNDFLVDEEGDPEAPLVPELEDQDNLTSFEDQSAGVKPASLGGAIRLLADKTKPTWWTRTFPSPYRLEGKGGSSSKRICRGSPYNCFVPNPHPDANRFHPPAALEAFRRAKKQADTIKDEKARGDARKAALKAYQDSGRTVKPGTRMHDGAGAVILTDLKQTDAKVNFGLHRMLTLDGTESPCVYVWKHEGKSAFDGKTNFAAGWVKKTDFVYAAGDDFDRGTKKSYAPKAPKNEDAREEVRAIRTAEDLGNCSSGPTFTAEASCYSKLDASKKIPGIDSYTELKVKPPGKVPVSETDECKRNCKVGDYLVRKNGVLNLAYATPLVGGLSAETRIVKEGDTFNRFFSKNKKWRFLLAVPLFKPEAKNVVVGKMFFAYGHWGDRYGWMALDALRDPKATKASVPSLLECQGKADGMYCLDASAVECVGNGYGTNVSCADPSKKCVVGADGKASMGADGKPICR